MHCNIAQKKDIPELFSLLTQLFSQEKEFEVDEKKQTIALNKIIEDEKLGDIFVASKNGKIVAMVNVLYTISTALGNRVAILEDMIVDEGYRGQNIGSSLINFTLSHLKEHGFKRVTLLSDDDNFQAHKFYDRHGFSKSSMITFRKSLG